MASDSELCGKSEINDRTHGSVLDAFFILLVKKLGVKARYVKVIQPDKSGRDFSKFKEYMGYAERVFLKVFKDECVQK